MKVTKKANLSTREKQALKVVENNTNQKTVEAVAELDELQKYTSHLMDTMFFRSIRKGSVSEAELNDIISEFEAQVKRTLEAVDNAKDNRTRVIEIVRTEKEYAR